MSRHEITIRRATNADVGAINTLMQESSAYQGQYRSILEGYKVSLPQIERDQAYVATRYSTLIGFYSLIVNLPDAELDLLFVSDAAQGFGIGSALVLHLKQLATSLGIDAIRIVSHPPALGFYLHAGAEWLGTVPPHGPVSWERPLLTLRISNDSCR